MKHINRASYVVIILSYIICFYFVWQTFIPLRPVVFLNSPFPVITKQVKQGGYLIYTANHCKYIDTVATVNRSLVDGIQYTLPEVVSSVPRGCGTLNIMTVQVPPVIPPGTYYLNITLTYHINPFRTYTITVQTQKFEVISNNEK